MVREFCQNDRIMTQWAQEMTALVPPLQFFGNELVIELARFRLRDIGIRGCVSYPDIAEALRACQILQECPAQVGPDFWRADRKKLREGEKLRICMKPILTDARPQRELGGIYELYRRDGAQDITLAVHAALGNVSFDEHSEFVAKVADLR